MENIVKSENQTFDSLNKVKARLNLSETTSDKEGFSKLAKFRRINTHFLLSSVPRVLLQGVFDDAKEPRIFTITTHE